MKKALPMILALVLCLSLCACGDGVVPTPTKELDVSTNNTTNTTTGDAQPQQTQPLSTKPTENVIVDTTPILAAGEGATTTKCEFKIEYFKITRDVLPPNPGRVYSHYAANDGKVLVDLCVAYKNTDTVKIVAEKTISGKLIYSGTYEYTGFSMIEEDNRSDFTYSNITSIAPLSKEYVHYLFEVPEEVETSGSEIVLKMNIGGEKYRIVVRDGNGTETEDANKQETKTSGEVVLREIVVTKNSEFSIDYSEVTRDVIPPNPGRVYSHYEADDGEVFVDVCFAYKNTRSNKIGADDVISAKLKYAGKYTYTGATMIEEDSRSNFTYSNITSIAPLSTEYIHYLFAVPEELRASNEPIEITFTIDGNTYTYKAR